MGEHMGEETSLMMFSGWFWGGVLLELFDLTWTIFIGHNHMFIV